ncbi:MAG: ATP-binding protein [Deltaproteobacteria bacterium]|nr:ATP-binding protein [Deltaproteobacteria bacterium]
MEKISLSIKLKNRLVDLDKIKKAVLKMSANINCTKQRFRELDLILEELFTNVVCHGFKDNKEHDINISLSCDDSFLMIRMEDDGEPFDITAAAAPDTKCSLEKRCVGGLGIHFVKHFIDECKYYRKKNKNIVVLKKHMAKDDPTKTDLESGQKS